MMVSLIDTKNEFKEKLRVRIECFHRLDTIYQSMTAQLRSYNDLEMLRRQVENTKKTKENHMEKNESLKKKVDVNLLKKESLIRELDNVKRHEQEIIKNQESRVDHVKYLWKSLIIALDFYKHRLNCHIAYQDDCIVWTFKNLSADNKKKYFVKLVNQDGRWSCTEMVPKLKSREALMETLKETNDIQSFLSNVRNKFKKAANLKI